MNLNADIVKEYLYWCKCDFMTRREDKQSKRKNDIASMIHMIFFNEVCQILRRLEYGLYLSVCFSQKPDDAKLSNSVLGFII